MYDILSRYKEIVKTCLLRSSSYHIVCYGISLHNFWLEVEHILFCEQDYFFPRAYSYFCNCSQATFMFDTSAEKSLKQKTEILRRQQKTSQLDTYGLDLLCKWIDFLMKLTSSVIVKLPLRETLKNQLSNKWHNEVALDTVHRKIVDDLRKI